MALESFDAGTAVVGTLGRAGGGDEEVTPRPYAISGRGAVAACRLALDLRRFCAPRAGARCRNRWRAFSHALVRGNVGGMARPWTWLFSLAAALALASSIVTPRADACFAVGRRGPVPIRGEEAMIVWDAARRTEHLVRRAGFRSVRSDFGFLVPTPSRPELLEVASGFFDTLFNFYAASPREIVQASSGGGDGRRGAAAARPEVRVLEQRHLAGMEATVLLANDAGALSGWLRRHRYPSSRALSTWLEPYVAQGWTVTAFRVDPSGGSSTFQTASVRLSFATERPFFPYSEPAAGPARPFRVSVIAPTKMRAELARVGDTNVEPWGVPVGYAGAPAGLSRLESTVPLGSIPHGSWLTTFDEPRSRRGDRDLFFTAAPDASPVTSSIARVVGF